MVRNRDVPPSDAIVRAASFVPPIGSSTPRRSGCVVPHLVGAAPSRRGASSLPNCVGASQIALPVSERSPLHCLAKDKGSLMAGRYRGCEPENRRGSTVVVAAAPLAAVRGQGRILLFVGQCCSGFCCSSPRGKPLLRIRLVRWSPPAGGVGRVVHDTKD